jgi:CheY-like chemotaxis protein
MSPEKTQKRLVLIEDNESDVYLIREGLRIRGLDLAVTWYDDVPRAREGLSSFEQDPPDAVLLDLNLPGGDGFELLHIIRSKLGNVPVTVFTSSESPLDKERARSFDIEAYVYKPVSLDAFFSTVGNAVERMLKESKDPANGTV